MLVRHGSRDCLQVLKIFLVVHVAKTNVRETKRFARSTFALSFADSIKLVKGEYSLRQMVSRSPAPPRPEPRPFLVPCLPTHPRAVPGVSVPERAVFALPEPPRGKSAVDGVATRINRDG